MPISKLEVSVSDLTKRPRVQITQGDRRSRVIEATVTDGGSPMDLTGKRARFRAELPLGKVVIDDGCEVADAEAGVIRYTVGDEVAARSGHLRRLLRDIRRGRILAGREQDGRRGRPRR